MKQPKKPTRNQKEIIRSNGLNENDYMIVRESEFYIVLIHKKTCKQKRIDNYLIKGGGR